jgi:hypothetical protein
MDELVGSIAALFITIVVFLIFRFVVLWYWKINVAIDLLKSIDEKLDRLPRSSGFGG